MQIVLPVCILLLVLNVCSHVRVVVAFGTFSHTCTSKHSVGRLTGKHDIKIHTYHRLGSILHGHHPARKTRNSRLSFTSASASSEGQDGHEGGGNIKKIALLTSGGDCPSLNACIRAIVKSAKSREIEVYGLPMGLPGLLYQPDDDDDDDDDDDQENKSKSESAIDHYKIVRLDDDDTFVSTSMLTKGGSRLGGFVSSDFSIFDNLSLDERADRIGRALDMLGIQGIIATGGDSSLDRIAVLLSIMKNRNGNGNGDEGESNVNKSSSNIRFVGVPKTIDNDIPSTIFSLGFQSAVSTAAQAIASARDTAESHRRIIVVECMGRDAGFLTLHAGLAGGADVILIPEFPLKDGEDLKRLLSHVERVYEKNQCAIVAVAESVTLPQDHVDDNGEGLEMRSETDYNRRRRAFRQTPDGSRRFGGSAETVARFLAQSLDVDARHIVLGHLQRGGSPNAFDQVLATTLGAHAVKTICSYGNDSASAAIGGGNGGFVTWNGENVEVVPLESVSGVPSKAVTADYPEFIAAEELGIYCGGRKR